jgi:sugar phosphate isomerase/epimerase
VSGGRLVSMAHLTLIDVAPPLLVRVAAQAGYDAVGLRIVPVTDGPDYTMKPGSAALRETVKSLRDTGLRVLDAEVIRLTADTVVGDYEEFFDVAAELRARFVVVVVRDPDPGRAAATFAALAARADLRRLTLMVEFMIFSTVRTLADAEALLTAAAAPNAGILVDPLHLARSGSTVEQVRRLPAGLVPYVQFCDAASALPVDDEAAAGAEARRSRLLPGEGTLPLGGLLAAIGPEAPLSLEVPDGWSNPDPLARARAVLHAAELYTSFSK